MSERIIVTGSTGLVGSRFVELHNNKDELLTPSASEMDITSRESILNYLKNKDIKIIINFAAYTDLNAAETEKGNKDGICWKLNVVGVQNLLSVLPRDTHFIQISTDNVFPGSKKDPGPYDEYHPTDYKSEELCWYGYTKNLAEKEVIKKLGNDATILRLIYPSSSKYGLKTDFLRKPLHLFDEGKLYPMFDDQQISISLVDSIAEALNKIIIPTKLVKSNKPRIFHASSEDVGTPFEIISYLIEKVRRVKNAVKPSSLDDFLKTVDSSVRYPKYGGLKVEKTEKELGIKFGTWKEMIDKFTSQIETS